MAVDYIPLSTGPDEVPPDTPYGSRQRPWRSNRATALIPRIRVLLAATFALLLVLALPHIHRRYTTRYEPLVAAENPYFRPGNIWAHNDDVSARLERCAELGLLQNTSLPSPLHLRNSPEEEADLIAQGCGTNQTTIIILASLWSSEAFNGVSTAGETIYAQSVISTLNAYNYSYMFSNLGWNNYEMHKTREIWDKHRWNVRLVMVDPLQADHCWENKGCLKTDEDLDGIEAWRLVSFWYWDDPGNPLGAEFTLSPSPRNSNHFLSFSIEPTCRRLPYVSHEERAHPPQAYLLAKQIEYFNPENKFQGYAAWTIKGLAHIQNELGIAIVGGMNRDHEDLAREYDASGMTNFGQLDKIGFYNHLARSFVMVGIGKPRISPSPFDAMCMGVPFINPILIWDEADPKNRTAWKPQQWWMTDLEPRIPFLCHVVLGACAKLMTRPYVYHVQAHDQTALELAIYKALHNPIDSFIPPYMKFDHVCDRMAEVMEGDWRAKGQRILEERQRTGEGKVFLL